MIKKTILNSNILLVVLFCTLIYCQAQEKVENNLIPLKIGDTVPDLVFTKMINYGDSVTKLSDFSGKAVILDFWATWCLPCVVGFAKLEKLQRGFPNQLQVLLLSNDDEIRLKNFYKNKKSLSLPTAQYIDKSAIANLFPHREIPHYVWIDGNRKIYAITDASQVTENTLKNFIENKPQRLATKNDSLKGNFSGIVVDSIEYILGKINTVSLHPNILYESKFTKYDPHLTPLMSLDRADKGTEYTNRFLELQNVSVVHLMEWALGCVSASESWQFFLELNDTTLTYPASNYKEWAPEHAYTYRLILNKPDSALRFRILKRDLELVFDIRNYKKNISVPCLVLRKISDSTTILTKKPDSSYISGSIYRIKLVNQPVKSFLKILDRYQVGKEHKLKEQLRLPILDRSEISGNIDLDVNGVNIRDLPALNNALSSSGLSLSIENVELEMIVITDKKANPTHPG